MTDDRTRGEKFGGKICKAVYESEPWWPELAVPKGKPNMVLIVLDDNSKAVTRDPPRTDGR